jgi:hypothetical protein
VNFWLNVTLDVPPLLTGELAVGFTNSARYFLSEASVYHLLKTHHLIVRPSS